MLVDYAREELDRAGMFDEDADYGGNVGPVVMQMMQQFAASGQSGGSAGLTLDIFARLARYKPLMPVLHPMTSHATGGYVDHTEISDGSMYQSTRLSTLFSSDGGKRWFDVDLKVPWWKRLFGVRRVYVTFPYMPK